MGVVEHISDRVAVMYLGALVEVADAKEIYRLPVHPYTIALLSAVPVAKPSERASRRRIILRGDVPSPVNPPAGCRFHTRCWLRTQLGNPERCATERPELRPWAADHEVACHYAEELLEPTNRQRRIAAAAAGSSGLASAEVGGRGPSPTPAARSRPTRSSARASRRGGPRRAGPDRAPPGGRGGEPRTGRRRIREAATEGAHSSSFPSSR